MSSNSTADNLCDPDDTLCVVREYQQAVIIVPTLLLFATLITLLPLLLLMCCARRRRARAAAAPRSYSSNNNNNHNNDNNNRSHRYTQSRSHRRHLQGVDAPPGINPLEHEELPMSVQVQQVQSSTPVPPVPAPPPQAQAFAFSQLAVLPLSFSIRPDDAVSLHRARMDHRGVVLRVLRETANASERQHFLGFASFVSGLGPHPFIPALLGVASVRSPLVMAVEELQHRDLLGFLWRCRQDPSGSESSCHMTEKRIFAMAGQVASALEYLHAQGCVHGNVGARSVLVGADLTAKLWGLSSAYRRRSSPGEVDDVELRKWQAPEVLARRAFSQSSDVWSFGILLYEMVTLGDPPFSQLMATEVLQHLQRGRHLKRPAACSSSLFSIIMSCCSWSPQQRPPLSGLVGTLRAGEASADGRTALRAPGPLDIGRYLREAGYGEAYNYAVL